MGHRILSPPAQNITLSGLQNMQVPELSIIRLLGEADGEWRAASREDLGDWFGSKGKWLEVPRVAVEALKVADR
jgi:hypothetical protein